MTKMLDLTSIRKIANGNQGVVRQFLEIFADNTSKDLVKLTSAIHSEDAHQVSYFVHKLKSTTQSIGFLNGHKELQRIEDILHLSPAIKPLRKELLNVTRECELAVVEARKLLEKHIS